MKWLKKILFFLLNFIFVSCFVSNANLVEKQKYQKFVYLKGFNSPEFIYIDSINRFLYIRTPPCITPTRDTTMGFYEENLFSYTILSDNNCKSGYFFVEGSFDSTLYINKFILNGKDQLQFYYIVKIENDNYEESIHYIKYDDNDTITNSIDGGFTISVYTTGKSMLNHQLYYQSTINDTKNNIFNIKFILNDDRYFFIERKKILKFGKKRLILFDDSKIKIFKKK
jgi:hypothetical protein